ncbi:YesL family protein [Demequina litorisediminis]|uniref:Transmembrane protein (PGPGW) n=1 Tax=Demequina litorisediminis TaxID=1849022 RepID=A0ABQ6IDI5_9MICO|nr:YesL family protein [Demequina litorisediminis]GMA34803.1 hypothetical protein GCM10025876_10070 [Demequina litorisediminis]
MATPRQRRAAAKAELDGTGPTRAGWLPHVWPGAHTGFALWGEVLLAGIMIALAALPILTAPAALAAGVRHLTRYLRGEASPWREFWADVRSGAVGSAGIALVTAVVAGVLVVDIQARGHGTSSRRRRHRGHRLGGARRPRGAGDGSGRSVGAVGRMASGMRPSRRAVAR